MKPPLENGMEAPDFILPRDGGGTAGLSDFAGQPVVVYFYPKDLTPGCTTEAIDFTATKAEFDAANTVIIGISLDPPTRHDQFKEKHRLDVILASDEDHAVAARYGVWVEKNMYGRRFMGIERATFLISGTGEIVKYWRKVRVKGHVREVLAAARELSG